MMWRIEPPKQEGNKFNLYIYDEITEYGKFNWNTWEYDESETSAKYFRDELEKIPAEAEIELHINSNGGSVKEATAIYNILNQKGNKKIGYVDGVSHSAAFLLFQACDHRIMGIGTTALVHNMWVTCQGNAQQLRKMADDLDAMMEANRKIFLQKSNITEEKLMELMDAETYLTPEQCLEYGLCDEISEKDSTREAYQATVQQLAIVKKELASQQSFRTEAVKLIDGIKAKEKEPKKEPKDEPKSEPEPITESQKKMLKLLDAMQTAFLKEA